MSDELDEEINDSWWRRQVPDITDTEIDTITALWRAQHERPVSAAAFSVHCLRAGKVPDAEAVARSRWAGWAQRRLRLSEATW